MKNHYSIRLEAMNGYTRKRKADPMETAVTIRRAPTAPLLCLGVLMFFGADPLHAATSYSYIDDRGTPVYTDALETIPEKYRAKVKTHERPDPPPPTALQSMQAQVKEQARNLEQQAQQLGERLQLKDKVPSLWVPLEGMNPAQSRIVTYSAAAAVVLLLMMYLSKSQLVRMLGFCLLIALAIGAPVLMYVSEDGPMDRLKQKATAAGQAQHNRADQIPR